MTTIDPQEQPQREYAFSSSSETKQTDSHGLQTAIPGRPVHILRPRSLGDLSQVKAASKDSHESAAHHLTKQFDALEAARADEMLLRSRFDAARLLWRRYRRNFRKTRALYEDAIDPFRTDAITSSQDPKLVNLRALLEIDRASLENQSIEVTTLRRNLESLKGHLQGAEIEFMEAARQQSTQFGLHAPPSFSVGSTALLYPSRVGSSSDSPPVHPLMKQYWEQAAQVAILGERLANNNFDYLNALATRQLRHDRDEALSLSDEEFEALFAREKMGIVQSLDTAVLEADRLKAECLSAGLDVEEQTEVAPFFEDESISGAELERHQDYQRNFEDLMSRVPPQAFEDAELIQDVPSENDSETFKDSTTDDKVNSWFDNLQRISSPAPVDAW